MKNSQSVYKQTNKFHDGCGAIKMSREFREPTENNKLI
jgi:hypothetical protein